MQPLILFGLQTNLIKRFILSKFTGIYPLIHNYMARILRFLRFYFYIKLLLFLFLALIIVLVPCDFCFYVYFVKVHFYRKKYLEKFKIITSIKFCVFLSYLESVNFERSNISCTWKLTWTTTRVSFREDQYFYLSKQ